MRRQQLAPTGRCPFVPAGTRASHKGSGAVPRYPPCWQGEVAGCQAAPGAGVGPVCEQSRLC